MARKTEEAEATFRNGAFEMLTSDPAVKSNVCLVQIARGLAMLSVALRDIYDLQQATHAEVKALRASLGKR